MNFHIPLLFIILFVVNVSIGQKISGKVKVNQVGYLINHNKIASVNNINPSKNRFWYIKDLSGQTVFDASIPNKVCHDISSKDLVFKLDFSSFNTPGVYFIEIENLGKSYYFEISDAAYNNVFKAVSKSFYYQRCGFDLDSHYAGQWGRKACHFNDSYIYNGFSDGNIIAGSHINSTGGWHDAGDFGKKVVPAAVALYHILKSSELFSDKINSATFGIPPGTFEMPDLLKEAKYELDWFFTQQRSDGAIYHLVTSQNFASTLPDEDLQTRYSVPVSATATADFAAIMSLASKVYRPYNTSYADTCLKRAIKAWNYLQSNPQIFPGGGYADPPGINHTGEYADNSDADERLWAAAELYNATGESTYRKYFESHYDYWTLAVDRPGGWGNVQEFAMFTYCFATKQEKTNAIAKTIKSQIKSYANSTVQAIKNDGYGVALTSDDYNWSSNAMVLTYGADLLMASILLSDSAYVEAALSHLNYILGSNSLNLSFVTGIGSNRVMNPCLSISGLDEIIDPVPGFVTGGPNKNSNDPCLSTYISENNPAPAKCFVDNSDSWSSNEPAICIMSGLVFLSGYFYNNLGTPLYTALRKK
jgi:endoglucanase